MEPSSNSNSITSESTSDFCTGNSLSILSALDILQPVDDNYGIETEILSFSNSNDIIIPETTVQLSTAKINLLGQIDPLMRSDNYAIDIYESVLEHWEHCMHVDHY